MYVSDEKRNQLHMFRMLAIASSRSGYTRDTLFDRANAKPRQQPSTIHVHPNGGFVYIANRADHTVDFNGTKVFGGGENTITVFEIDSATGDSLGSSTPTLTRSTYARSASIRAGASPGHCEHQADERARRVGR